MIKIKYKKCPLCDNRLRRMYIREYIKKYTNIQKNKSEYFQELVGVGWMCMESDCKYIAIERNMEYIELGNIEKLIKKLEQIQQIINS